MWDDKVGLSADVTTNGIVLTWDVTLGNELTVDIPMNTADFTIHVTLADIASDEVELGDWGSADVKPAADVTADDMSLPIFVTIGGSGLAVDVTGDNVGLAYFLHFDEFWYIDSETDFTQI